MTVMTERASQMQVGEIASKAPETVMLEFIDSGASPGAARGRIAVKRMPDGDHATITMRLLRQCIRAVRIWICIRNRDCGSACTARDGATRSLM